MKSIVEVAEVNRIFLIVVRNTEDVGKSCKSAKINVMLDNFWFHGFVARRLDEKAEECRVAAVRLSEKRVSIFCPRILSTRVIEKRPTQMPTM